MDDPNGTPASGDSGDANSTETVSQHQFKHTVGTLQLQLKNIAFDTLDGQQKINLLAIKTLGIVYALTSIVEVLGAVFTSRLTFAELSANLQTVLVLFAIFYGVIMLLAELAEKAVSVSSLESNVPEPAENEG